MPKFTPASPLLQVRLYKTISRKTVDGQAAVSARYEGKDEFIDLVPFMQSGSMVRTSKSVREPAGGFSITFADQAQRSGAVGSGLALESVYGLVEPMDIVEIRMWGGVGSMPDKAPIIMRGFVSEIQRQQAVGENGQPQRQVVVTGQDYGKIWQLYQVLFLPAYAEGKPLLTNFALAELFGQEVYNVLAAGDFIRTMVKTIINPHIKGFVPDKPALEKEIKTGDSISVEHGVVNINHNQMQGSVYDIMRFHGDVGVWNELYTEDREDGVHCVYRAIPALHLTKPQGAKDRKIQDDAPDPIFVPIPDDHVQSISQARSDSGVANFYWVNNSRFDLIDDLQRKLFSLKDNATSVYPKEYANVAVKYYGIRPMNAETQQGEDKITNIGSKLEQEAQEARSLLQESWVEKRRRLMMEMNRDNVVLERGSARIKGGAMRPDGAEAMKAGDYARFQMGRVEFDAYVVQIDHEFAPFSGYTTTLYFERGEGFARRISEETGIESPWLAEQASRLWSI